MDEDRHVGAQRQAELFQFAARHAGPPQVVEGEQDAGRIRRTAAETAAHRQRLLEMDRRPLPAAGMRLQQAGSAHRQIVVRSDARRRCRQLDAVVATRREAQPVAAIDEAEYRLQQVVTVGATADNVQEEVELGRCRPAGQALRVRSVGPAQGRVVHESMTRRMRASPREMSRRAGGASADSPA
ncbi:hypothetical protein SDC9_166195 [bioreactor metagenome]|uniref:Uncharacterized protein n=1 Tax=bioreactor metagenome TaxID=1076179 RepID=A0A645FYV0_9ZZZZ